MKITYKKLVKSAKDPIKAHKIDAGFDLCSNDQTIITTSSIAAIGTGIAFNIPNGYYGQIQERSGFSLKNTLKLKAGVIDAGYQGEIKLVFVNTGDAPVKIYPGDKIAQIIFHKLPPITLQKVDDFSEDTDRSTDGFGSSDTKAPVPASNARTVKKKNTVTVSKTAKKK
jgi:dUTP pyrophosphatase